jgi:hypothetical protein
LIATTTAANALNVVKLTKIACRYAPTYGIKLTLTFATPASSNAIAATKKLVTSLEETFKKPITKPNTARISVAVSAFSISANKPAITAIKTPAKNAYLPGLLFPVELNNFFAIAITSFFYTMQIFAI